MPPKGKTQNPLSQRCARNWQQVGNVPMSYYCAELGVKTEK